MAKSKFESYKKEYESSKPKKYLTKELKETLLEGYQNRELALEEEESNFLKYGKYYDYIGRIDLEIEAFMKEYKGQLNGNFYEKYYISKNIKKDLSKNPWEDGFVDWRSDIGNLYYSTEKDFAYWDYGNYVERAVPMLRRSIDLENKDFTNFYIMDSDIDLAKLKRKHLIKSIEKQRKKYRVTDIIDTMQARQNQIVREDLDKSIIVQGCAGSGKTMILLHRLSYVIYKNKKYREKYDEYLINLDRIKIITPSEDFQANIRDISSDLELDQIEQLSIFEYYISLLRNYVRENKLTSEKSQLDLEKIFMEVPKDTSKNINNKIDYYYFNYMDGYYDFILYDEINKKFNKNRDFIDKKYSITLSDKNILEDYKINLEKCLGKKNEKVLQSQIQVYKFEIEKYTRSNKLQKIKLKLINNFIDGLQNFTDDILSYTEKIRMILKESIKEIEELYNRDIYLEKLRTSILNLCYFLGNNYSNLKSFKINENFLSNLVDISDSLLKDIEIKREDVSLAYLSEIEVNINLLMEYSLENKNKIQKQTKFVNKKIEENYKLIKKEHKKKINKKNRKKIEEIILELNNNDYIIGDLYNEISYRLDKEDIDYSQVYLLLRICILHYGALKESDKMVMVDEGQDYPYDTYETVIQANSKTELYDDFHLNIFGDLNQILNEDISLSKWEDLKNIKKFKIFRLKENFRNTIQNTNYCKNKLDIDVDGIGLEGTEIKEIDYSKRQDYFDLEVMKGMDRRFAIISDEKNRIRFEGINRVDIKSYTPEEVKGLEFEVVFVYDKNFNRNEKYIAYTRSMEELYILN